MPVAALVATIGAAGTVLIVRDHPPAIDPDPSTYSSSANKFHVPLGEVPLNSCNDEPNGFAGAGAGNASLSPTGLKFVGRYVPDVMEGELPGKGDAAVSSNTRLT